MTIAHYENAEAGDRTRMGLPPRDFKSVVAGGTETEERAIPSIDSGSLPPIPAGRHTISDTPAGSVAHGTATGAAPSWKGERRAAFSGALRVVAVCEVVS
jgi:hypothetical protein